jgi:4-azaleucine resistance transporter AzlC
LTVELIAIMKSYMLYFGTIHSLGASCGFNNRTMTSSAAIFQKPQENSRKCVKPAAENYFRRARIEISMNAQMKTFWMGVQAEIPLLIGVFPFGMIYGALALNAGLSTAAAQLMSSMVFAGSAQFITAQLVHDAVPGFVILLTIAVVNLRHMLYSASLAPYLAALPARWKAILSYLLTDEAYAPTIIQYEKCGITPHAHWFLLGAGVSLWLVWQVSTALGIFLGAAIPESWSLDFALPLTFIAMVVPVLKNRAAIAAALSAGVVALTAFALPYKLGLILAALVGILVGTLLEGKASAKELL